MRSRQQDRQNLPGAFAFSAERDWQEKCNPRQEIPGGLMDSGLYTAYSGLRATADALDVVSNNLANVNTTGFKGDETFVRIFHHAANAAGAGPLDSAVNDSSYIRGTVSNFQPGVMK